MKARTAIICSGFVGFALASCKQEKSTKKEPVPKDVIAWVGTEAITENELLFQLKQRGIENPDERARADMLAMLADARRYYLSGKEKGWHNDSQAERSARHAVTLRVQREIEKQFEEISISDVEVSEFYQEHQENFMTPVAAQGAIIFRQSNPTESAEFLTNLASSHDLSDPLTFGELASKHSQDTTTQNQKGRMRWLSANQRNTSRWPSEVFDELLKLTEIGEVSPVTSAESGSVFVVSLLDIRPSQILPLKNVQGEIKVKLHQAKRQKIEKKLQEELASKYPLKMKDE